MPKTDDPAGDPIATLMLGGSAWSISPDAFPRIIAAARQLGPGAPAAAAPQAATRRPRAARSGGQVAVLALTGILTPRGSWLSMLFGGGYGGLQDFRDEFAQAVASPDIGSIVIDVDSPGGMIGLVPETAADIRAASGTKPIIAIANTQCASAAYWIASQADEIVITPSGQAGSIGVYMLHEDWSGWNAQAGIDPTYISAGRYKTEGNPDEPLDDVARAAWQQDVDDLYAMFVDDVAAGRGTTSDTVISDYGEGRCLLAQRAVDAGLCDRIGTIEDVIAEQLSGDTSGAAALAKAARKPVPTVAAAAAPTEDVPGPDEPELEPDEPDAEAAAAKSALDRGRIAAVLFD